MTVSYIRPGKTKGYLRVGVSDTDKKYDFSVSETDYREAGSPLSGDKLTRDIFDFLFFADMKYRAKLKALRILSYGDNSERMLARKLSASGINREVAEETVREMVRLGYINSSRQLEALITNEVNIRNTGPRKIVPKLIAKGYNGKDIAETISDLEERGIIDFEKAKKRLITSKLPTDTDGEEVKKLLYKSGYYV